MGFREFTSQTWSGGREPSRPMPLGLRHIMLPRLANPLLQPALHPPPPPRGAPPPPPPAAPRPDSRPVEQHAPHADQAVVLDGAAVQDRAVPHADAGADAHRGPRSVHHTSHL